MCGPPVEPEHGARGSGPGPTTFPGPRPQGPGAANPWPARVRHPASSIGRAGKPYFPALTHVGEWFFPSVVNRCGTPSASVM